MQAQNGGSFPEVRQRQPGTPPALYLVSAAPARARWSDRSVTACLRTGCRAAIGPPRGLLCTHLAASGSPPPARWEADAVAGLSLLAGPSQPCPALSRPWVPSGTSLPESRGSVVTKAENVFSCAPEGGQSPSKECLLRGGSKRGRGRRRGRRKRGRGRGRALLRARGVCSLHTSALPAGVRQVSSPALRG